MTGRFVTLEGGEGVGKSTQADRLASALADRGHGVIITREPGGTPGAEAIRGLLMTGSEDRWSARAEALLFAAARADHVEKVIRPALAQGLWVVCDRFIDSTRAYQGGLDGMPDQDILSLHKLSCDGLMPDRTLLLALPVAEAGRRAEARASGNGDRFGRRHADFHHALGQRFEAIAASDPQRIRRIAADGAPGAVTMRLLDELSDLL